MEQVIERVGIGGVEYNVMAITTAEQAAHFAEAKIARQLFMVRPKGRGAGYTAVQYTDGRYSSVSKLF